MAGDRIGITVGGRTADYIIRESQRLGVSRGKIIESLVESAKAHTAMVERNRREAEGRKG